MKVAIKFRGVDLKTGEFVYGDFVHVVPMSSFNGIIDREGKIHTIEPKSSAQLVGYDSKKREVYEGDRVVDKFGEEYIAQLTPTLRENHEGAGIFFRPTERFWVNISSYGTLTLVE